MSDLKQSKFERQRQEAIDALKALHFDNDPHFVVMTGNHDDSITVVCSCKDWVVEKCTDVATAAILASIADHPRST